MGLAGVRYPTPPPIWDQLSRLVPQPIAALRLFDTVAAMHTTRLVLSSLVLSGCLAKQSTLDAERNHSADLQAQLDAANKKQSDTDAADAKRIKELNDQLGNANDATKSKD